MHSEAIPKSNNCPTNSSLDSLAIPGSSYFGIFFFAGCRKLKAEALLGPHYLRAEGSSNHRLLRCFSSHTKTRPQKGAEEYPSGHPQHLCTANGLGCKSTFKPRHAQHSSSLDGKLWILLKSVRREKYTSFLSTDLKASLSAEGMEQAHHTPPGLLSDTKQPSSPDPSHGPWDMLGMTSWIPLVCLGTANRRQDTQSSLWLPAWAPVQPWWG